ncbi:hypothetical protein SAY87_025979 [Trapa incisa]|uniref:Uncharacterized protein n=1 Tax=Trapa incisa TaxID=236973 RepID=A0AAN7GUQ1_9MYRT|nr:hypothetical protein SAY87_025979 [Trapa incisa]
MEGSSRRLVQLLPSSGRGGSVRRMRRPLADCTNTARNSSQSSSSPSTSLLKPQAKPDFSIPQSKSQFDHGNKKVTARSSSSSHVAPASDQPPLPLPKSSYASANQFESHGPFAVEGQGRDAGKSKTKAAKAVTVPASRSPARRTRVSRDKLEQDKEVVISKSCLVPKKRVCSDKREQDSTKKALEDYIQKQRSYYAEIDAFELSEEEVDSAAALD